MRSRGVKSFVDDLALCRGVVLSRAATSLRSIETKPFDSKICPLLDGQHLRGGLGESRQTECGVLLLPSGAFFFYLSPSFRH